MKKLLSVTLFITFSLFLLSCGNDDDVPAQSLQETLVLNSPYTFSSLSISGITFNPDSITEDEAKLLFDNQFSNSSIDFSLGGLGTFSIQGNTVDFTYIINGDDISTNITDLYFNNVAVDGLNVSFDWEYCVSASVSSDVCSDIRFTYN